MPLSWNEIRDSSIAFVRKWENESSEDAEAKSFGDAFFQVFGVNRRRLASLPSGFGIVTKPIMPRPRPTLLTTSSASATACGT